MITEQSYDKLRSLYTGKDPKLDAFSVGVQLQQTILPIFKDIADPFPLNAEVRILGYDFDLRFDLTSSRVVLVEVLGGNLTESKMYYLSDIAPSLSSLSPSSSFNFVMVGKGLKDNDRPLFDKIWEKLLKTRVRLSLINFETLIELHKFSLSLKGKTRRGDLRRFKRLFLTNVFETPIVSDGKTFEWAREKAWVNIRERTSGYGAGELRSAEHLPLLELRLLSIERQLQQVMASNQTSQLPADTISNIQQALSELRRLRNELYGPS
jgi:hypothetical protein